MEIIREKRMLLRLFPLDRKVVEISAFLLVLTMVSQPENALRVRGLLEV